MISFSFVTNMLKKKTNLEKSLIAVVLMLSVATVGLIIALCMKQKTQEGPVCHSAACHALGAIIRQSVDLNADPCQDFYTYCCGGWLKTHEVPPDMKKFGVIEQLQNEVLSKINGLLTSSNISGIAWRNAVEFYNSCMNTTAIEKRGATPLLSYFARYGGWPVVNSQWREKDFDWISALAMIELTTGYGYVIPLIVATDPKNTSRKLLQLDQPTLLFSEEILRQRKSKFSKSQLEKFQKLFVKIAQLLGADVSSIKEDFNNILDFETQLLGMMSSEEDMKQISYWYNNMTIRDLQRKIPEVNWIRYLQTLTNSSLLLLDGKPVIQNKDIIIVRDLPYIQKITKYLKVVHARQVANYLGWRVAMNLMLHLPKNFSDALQEYYNDSGYALEIPERWKICTNRVSSTFNQVTAFAYVDKYFPKRVKYEVNKLILDISFQFEKLLLSNDWMDRITKNAALKKLRAIKANVGYPDWIGDENNINDFFVKVNMPTMDDQVFENDLKLVEHRTMQVIKTLRMKPEKEEWPMSPIAINAGYSRDLNAITFPSAFLQLPVYDNSLPPYFNYAAIGSIIGHEITHGFDNEGSKRNASGEISDWWSQKSRTIFEEKANCFVEQYNRYGLEGRRTLAENIADNGGLRQAYEAFSSWKKSQLVIEKLPGLENFSTEQLFFLSYGSIWCTKYAEGMLNYTIREAEHAPSPYRLKITTENLKEFSESFKCNAKSSPDTVNRCLIW